MDIQKAFDYINPDTLTKHYTTRGITTGVWCNWNLLVKMSKSDLFYVKISNNSNSVSFEHSYSLPYSYVILRMCFVRIKFMWFMIVDFSE